MRFIKLVSIAAIASCALAIAVARVAPRPVRGRVFREAHSVPIDGVFLTIGEHVPRVLDTATGELSRLPLPAGRRLHNLAISDWSDEDGQRQGVGLWVAYRGSGERGVAAQIGLARLSLPSGNVLDCVADAPLLGSSPCWYPGPRPRVLFAAMDGRLYQCTFPDGRSPGSRTPEVKLVKWSSAARKPGNPYVIGPVWPKVPALGGRFIAEIADKPDWGHFTAARLWWLRLTPDGTTVAEMAPLSVPEPGDLGEAWECLPSAAALPDGGCVLAYQRTTDRGKTRDLFIVRAQFDADTGAPTFRASDARKIAVGVAPWPAAFSPDAAWVHVIQGIPIREGATVRRIPLGLDTLAAHATTARVP